MRLITKMSTSEIAFFISDVQIGENVFILFLCVSPKSIIWHHDPGRLLKLSTGCWQAS